MKELNYTQQEFLVAYKHFWGKSYDFNIGNAERMSYLLSELGLRLGNFAYTMDYLGPYSPGLLVELRRLRMNNLGISNMYYDGEDKDWHLEESGKKVDLIREHLRLEAHDNVQEWVDVLAGLCYISRRVLPGSGFEEVTKRLIKEDKRYDKGTLNEEAWQVLTREGLTG